MADDAKKSYREPHELTSSEKAIVTAKLEAGVENIDQLVAIVPDGDTVLTARLVQIRAWLLDSALAYQ